MSIKNRKILEEIAKRVQDKEEEKKRPKFTIDEFCFPKQKKFINDPARFKTAVCSRRAGKTVACAVDLLYTAKNKPGITCLYITLSRTNAKKIIWRELIRLNKLYALGGSVDGSELSITFDHGNGEESIIYISGAKDSQEIEKFRGLALYKVYIDECQSFRPYLQELIDDVIVPALFDYNGSLILIGTPGPVAAGVFYQASHNKSWSQHKWTIMDNPHIKRKSGKDPKQILKEERQRRGISEDDPTYRRESLGEWVQDSNALVYRYNTSKNDYLEVPKSENMYYVMGIDIGYEDADAIAIVGWSDDFKEVYVVEEFVQNKMNITQLVDQINIMKQKYKPVKMVMDAGALGKKIQEEIKFRHGINVEAAEKHRKFEFIELMNDDLRTGKLKIQKESQLAQDYNLIQWDRRTPGKLKISDTFHSDIADAALYAWREARHYAYEMAPKKLDPYSDEYMERLEQEEAEQLERRMNGEDQFEALYDPYEKMIGEDDEF